MPYFINPYWMVHCPNMGPTDHMHEAEEEAEQEAARLAAKYPSNCFYVLKTVTGFVSERSVRRVQLLGTKEKW